MDGLSRLKQPSFWLPILILFLVPAVVFWPAFSGQALGPWGHISPMAGNGVQDSKRAWDVLQADGALQFTVWRDLVFSAWKSGEAPLWNPWQLAGTTLVGNSQSAPFYPLHILFGVMGVGTLTAIIWLGWIHLFVAGMGIRALALRLGAREEAAVLAGIFVSLSPFFVAWSALPSVTTTACWIPVALNLTWRAVREPSLKPGALLGLVTGCMFLGGHLQFAFYGLIAVLFCAALWLWTERPAKIVASGGVLVTGLALGAMLSAVQVMPTLEFSKLSHRKTEATSEGFQAYAGSAVKPWELISLVTPGFVGLPGGSEEDSPEGFRVPTYWPSLVKPGANFAESAVSIGPAILLGLLMLTGSRLKNRSLWPLLGLGVVGLLLALGTPLAAGLYFGIPGFASTGSPGRAIVLFVVALGVVSAVAWPNATEEPNPKAKAYAVIALFIIAVVFILGINSLGGLTNWITQEPVGVPVARRMVETVPILILGCLLVAGAWFFWVKKGQILLGCALLAAGHLAAIPTQFLPFGTPPAKWQERPLVRTAYLNQNWDFLRPTTALMPPNLSAWKGGMDIAGYDSLLALGTVEMLKEINGGNDPAPPINGNMMFVKPGFSPDALAEAGVTEVWSRGALDGVAPAEEQEGFLRYSLPGPGLVSSEGGAATLGDVRAQGIDLLVEEPGEFTVRFRNLPGWRVDSGGTLVSTPEDRWLRVKADQAGKVILRFDPPGYSTGMMLSLVSLLICLGVLAGSLRKRPAKGILPEQNVVE
ncbi:MAG: hypothetical protein LCH41_05925 [Armatimonadetes bacterium]|nr:hypothetical protein [Armatimonadota bacterium]